MHIICSKLIGVKILDEEFHVRFNHNPIHHIDCRFKTPQSIVEKRNRKGYELSIKSIKQKLTDIAGIRVICNYIDDIYTISKLLLNQDDITFLLVLTFRRKYTFVI